MARTRFLCFIACMYLMFVPNESAEAFSEQIIQRGATGDDVVELQARLQYIGFYNGNIDGVFGWTTYWAVRNYQADYGLEVDGLVGAQMKDRLVSSTNYDRDFVMQALNEGQSFTHYGGTPKEIQKKDGTQSQGGGQKDTTIAKAQPVPAGYSENDIQLMAQAVYGEARGEPYEGQVAVAAVIINRVNSATFPNTVAGVIYEERAFTAVADGQINLQPDETARRAVLDAINGQDPSNNALYYFNPDTATSGWIWTRPQIKRIGKHIFCS